MGTALLCSIRLAFNPLTAAPRKLRKGKGKTQESFFFLRRSEAQESPVSTPQADLAVMPCNDHGALEKKLGNCVPTLTNLEKGFP